MQQVVNIFSDKIIYVYKKNRKQKTENWTDKCIIFITFYTKKLALIANYAECIIILLFTQIT